LGVAVGAGADGAAVVECLLEEVELEDAKRELEDDRTIVDLMESVVRSL
jgi:hypothetical protein